MRETQEAEDAARQEDVDESKQLQQQMEQASEIVEGLLQQQIQSQQAASQLIFYQLH